MGTFLTKLFVDVETLPEDGYGFVQVLFLSVVYGLVLKSASTLVMHGSELLLLVPALAGIVGSVLLPIMGTIPDAAILVFSGISADAQEKLNVGIGALAGSTVMLLTVPWCLAIIGGRVNLDANGNGNYVRPRNAEAEQWRKLDPPTRIRGSGVNAGPSIRYMSRVMFATLLPFLIIQIPAFVGKCGEEREDYSDCDTPRIAALIGAIVAALFFFFYLWDQWRRVSKDEVREDIIDQLRAQAVHDGLLTLRGLFPTRVMDGQGLIAIDPKERRFREFLRPFFHRFDISSTGSMDAHEFSLLIASLGEHPDKSELDFLMDYVDTDKNGVICFEEFVSAMVKVLKGEFPLKLRTTNTTVDVVLGASTTTDGRELNNVIGAAGIEEDFDEEETGDLPDELAHLSPEEQQKKLMQRAFAMMVGGVALILLFTDAMVDALSELGNRINVKPFYVAFVVAPFASNASELIAAVVYARKKTEKTINISFSLLIGSVTMNNTLCMCIFLFIVYARKLKWIFAAETLVMLIVELVIIAVAQLRVQRAEMGIGIAAIMPLAIAFVIGVEAAGLN